MSATFLAAAAARVRDATHPSDLGTSSGFYATYVWRGHGLGWIFDEVPYGCAMGQIQPVAKLLRDVSFAVLELRETAVGTAGTPKLYGRVELPAQGWVDLTTTRCEQLEGSMVAMPGQLDSSGTVNSGSDVQDGAATLPTLKQLTVRRVGAIKGSPLEYILVEVEDNATIDRLASLVKRHWLELTAKSTPPPAWLSTLRSRARHKEGASDQYDVNDDEWGVRILLCGRPQRPERRLSECAAEAEQPSLGFWGDFANSRDFEHGGVAAVAGPPLVSWSDECRRDFAARFS